MGTVLGIEPYKIIAAAVVLGLAAVFVTVLVAGPGAILSGAFGILSQTVSTAGIAVSGLVASSAGIVAQGMGAAANAVAQAGMVMAQGVAAGIGVASAPLQMAGAVIGAGMTLTSTVASSGAQALAAGTASVLQTIAQQAPAIAAIWSSIAELRIYYYQLIAQNGIIALSNYLQMVFGAISQVFTTLFTSLAAAAGQLFSIPLIALYGYVSVGTTLIGVVPGVTASVLGVFVNLFNKITEMFTGPFLTSIQDIPTTIGTEIANGFADLISSLPATLSGVFIP